MAYPQPSIATGKRLLKTKHGVKHPTRQQAILESSFHEVKHNPPKILATTRRKKGKKQAMKQRIAIALSKARKAGANVPPPPT